MLGRPQKKRDYEHEGDLRKALRGRAGMSSSTPAQERLLVGASSGPENDGRGESSRRGRPIKLIDIEGSRREILEAF